MNMQDDWYQLLGEEFNKPYYKGLMEFLKKESETKNILPAKEDWFNALLYTSYKDTKVVILGQDPYQTKEFPHGLSFSVNPGVKIPRSLQNIYRELKNDYGCPIPNHGCLKSWAEQGVLLLNTCLTVEEGVSNSHKGKGWEQFTDKIISLLNNKEESVVFIFWGNNAKSKTKLITNPRHYVIESAHPSPLSAKGFFGTKPFTKTNELLIIAGRTPINWEL